MTDSTPLNDVTTQFGLINSLRTGNMIFDMLIAVAIPMLFGGLATVLREASPTVRSWATQLSKRGEVTRTIVFERRVNTWGYAVSSNGQDHLLQKALLLYASKHSMPIKGVKTHKHGVLTLTELPAKEQKKLKDAPKDEYCSEDEGAATSLTNMEVSTMPPLDNWIEVGAGVKMKKSKDEDDGDDKSQVRKENTTVTLSCSAHDGTDRINQFVDKAYKWYQGTLEAERDEKRYMFMMLPSARKSEEDKVSTNRLYKRYELSDEKTFASLFFPEKKELLYLLDHFSRKTGKFAIPGFPHKLGLLLFGPPGTGKTSLIKAIAHYTKRHIVSVPLSKVKTNQELMDVMFDQHFQCVNTAKGKNDDVDEIGVPLSFKKVIFVMEDVDAASKVVHRRSATPQATTTTVTTKVLRAASHPPEGGEGIIPFRSNSSVANAAPSPLKPRLLVSSRQPSHVAPVPEEGREMAQEATEMEEVIEEEKVVVMSGSGEKDKPDKASWEKYLEPEDKLDLAGLLNVLDGVVDSPNRIVIMTTNHPEKLDPALIRPGRINKKILMGYLYPEQALDMVRHYFGDVTDKQAEHFRAKFIPNVFTPAQVEQLCAEHDTVDDFLFGLDGLKANEY